LKIISVLRWIGPNGNFQYERDADHQADPHLLRVIGEIASNARTW
jgi:hypothetical protein